MRNTRKNHFQAEIATLKFMLVKHYISHETTEDLVETVSQY